MSSPHTPNGGARSYTMAVQLSGQLTATTANLSRIRLNGRHIVLGVDAIARSSAGAGQSCAIDLTVGGKSLFTAPLAVTAGAMSSASMVNATAAGGPFRPVVADEGILSIGATLAGSNPVYADITLSIHLARG